MGAPSGWSLIGSSAGLSGGPPYVKVWTKVATSSEPASYTFTDSAASIFNSVAILAITTGTYDSVNPIAAAVTFQDGGTNNSASHTAPSVTGVSDGLLCTSHGADTGNSAGTVSYTPPSGMTEQADTSQGAGSYTALEVNTLTLAAAGATGQKTATCSVSRPWQCSSLVIAPVSGGGGGGGGGTVGFRAASADDRGTANSCVPAPPAGTTAGDLLLAVQTSDYRGTLTEMAAPSDWT
jgi:hypothetical protein